MINEGRGISNIIKEDVDKIYKLFLDNSYSNHTYRFGNSKLGFKDIGINFNHLNNYYSNIKINRMNIITVNIGIPTNGKEKRIKENIYHELTHVVEIIGLGNKEYPKYNKIKLSLIEFNNKPMSRAMEFILDVFYKTLDNEINDNVAQTYIYVKSDGRCSQSEALIRLNEWETYKFYSNIKNIRLDILEKELSKNEVIFFNNILIKNGVKTTNSDNISDWLKYWFKIFKRKADIFLNNSVRFLDEIKDDWEKFESYITSYYEYEYKFGYYEEYLKKFGY
jgi:hypothetical protein